MAALNFNANDVADRPSRDPLPAGEYKVVVEASQEKATKAGDGSYFEVTLVITDGEHEGRKLWHRMNLNNKSEDAVANAKVEMRQLCNAAGHPSITDTDQLHDIEVIAIVSLKADRQSGEMRNEVKGYKAVGSSSSPIVPGKPAPPKSGPTAAPGSKPAWLKRG